MAARCALKRASLHRQTPRCMRAIGRVNAAVRRTSRAKNSAIWRSAQHRQRPFPASSRRRQGPSAPPSASPKTYGRSEKSARRACRFTFNRSVWRRRLQTPAAHKIACTRSPNYLLADRVRAAKKALGFFHNCAHVAHCARKKKMPPALFNAGGIDASACALAIYSQFSAPPVWYSVTRVSKKLRSFFRSIISLIHGNGFSS
jgi:hypothetical protein